MVIRPLRFNIYLLALALLGCGCATTGSSSSKPMALLTVNVETTREAEGKSEAITFSRAHPIPITIQASPVVNETHIAEASLVDGFAGYTMVLQLTPMGTHLLEQYTLMYPGRRFAIAVQFGEKTKQARWIAAPVIKKRISDGVLAFTPDASREEAELIVKSLNNVAIKLENQKKKKIENNGR